MIYLWRFLEKFGGVGVLGWDCGWVGGSLEVMLDEVYNLVHLIFQINSIPTPGYADTASLRRSSGLGVWVWTLSHI